MERAGITSIYNDLAEVVGNLGGFFWGFKLSAGLNRVLAATIIWAAGIDCQTVALRIAGPNLMGVVAGAVVQNYSAASLATAGAEIAMPRFLLDGSHELLQRAPTGTLAKNRALAPVLTSSAEGLQTFESVMRQLDTGLEFSDATAVRAAVDSYSESAVELLENWSALAGIVQSTSRTALFTSPSYPTTIDSIAVGGQSAIAPAVSAVALASAWLDAPIDDAVRLSAQSLTREAIDACAAHQGMVTDFITELFTTPSDPYLHVKSPEVPPALANGSIGVVQTVVTNVGAGTAHDVAVSIVSDTLQLAVMPPAVIAVDSLVSGQSLVCSWQVMALDTLQGVVVASVLPTATDALGASRAFSLRHLVGAVTAVGPGTKVPALSYISDVYPNPASGEQIIEVFIGRNDPVGVLRIYDVVGRLVWTKELRGAGPGAQLVRWDGRGSNGYLLASGVYFATVRTQRGVVSKKILRLK